MFGVDCIGICIPNKMQLKNNYDRKMLFLFFISFVPQVGHTRKPCNRLPSLSWASGIANVTMATTWPAECCVPALRSALAMWTVAAVTAVAHWCATELVAGLCTESHPGVTHADYETLPVSTPKCPPSCPGSWRSLASNGILTGLRWLIRMA